MLIKCRDCAYVHGQEQGFYSCHLDPPKWTLFPGEGTISRLDGEELSGWQLACLWPEVKADTVGCGRGVIALDRLS